MSNRSLTCELYVESTNIETIRSYLQDLASGVTGNALAAYFTSDAIQIELPNRLNPNGGQSDLATLLTRAEQGRQILKKQTYEIISELVQENRVAIEALWIGTLAVPIGTLEADSEMRAHFAMFFELEEGRIRTQRNYDCFEPW